MSAVAHLQRIARPDLYARSPFRVLRQAIEIGIAPVDLCGLAAQIHLGDDRGLALPPPVVTPGSLDYTADVLRTPTKRLVEELFWWWDDVRGAGVPPRCTGCTTRRCARMPPRWPSGIGGCGTAGSTARRALPYAGRR
ncbi:hypothetical protein [Saccharothrix sp. ALI-22-I]|uniref:hypothetical protein n=1 Tax=Saccharothrix sp. ALI-22-I TaxID=1933778 RepID=UPI000A0774E9|nr:hypothetical protein [Saccharothrix sp. ALI-22-I]